MRLKLARWKTVSIAFGLGLCLSLSIFIPATQQTAHAIGEKFSFDDSTGTITIQGGSLKGPATLQKQGWASCSADIPSDTYWCFTGSVTFPGTVARENVPTGKTGTASCTYEIQIRITEEDLKDDNGIHVVFTGQDKIRINKTLDLINPVDEQDGTIEGNCKGDHSIISNSPGGTLGIIDSPYTIPVLSSADIAAQQECTAQDGVFDGVTKACALPICDPVQGTTGTYIVGAQPSQSCAYPKSGFPGGTCPAGTVDGAGAGRPNDCLGASRIPSAGSLAPDGAAEDTPDLCPLPKGAGLRWAACPIILGGKYITDTLDQIIDYLLTIDTAEMFGTATGSNGNIGDPSGGNSTAFYHVWSILRNLGISLIIIAGLVMVMSEMLGLQLVDAYTIRRILPRLAVAVIGIAVSWFLCYYLITFFNKLGHGTASLIYSSFGSLQQGGTSNGGAIGISIFAQYFAIGGGLVSLGLLGILSFLGTIMLALLIGAVILILREGIVVMCVIIAPIAIASYVLPNTSKFASFWWDTFIKALMAFPIITGFIAISKVMALITSRIGS